MHEYYRTGLPGKVTPAEAAGLDLKLGDNKLKNLIVQSAQAKEEAKKEYPLEPQLGKRMEYVDIIREEDCVSVKAKGWLPKPIWREINDILFINGFSWLENGKDSQWVRLNSQGRVAS